MALEEVHTEQGECPECWSDRYPKPCECGEGMIHAEFGDESYDGYWLNTECNACGEPDSDG